MFLAPKYLNPQLDSDFNFHPLTQTVLHKLDFSIMTSPIAP